MGAWRYGCFSGWRGVVSGPTAAAAQLIWGLLRLGGWNCIVCTASPATTGFSGAEGSAAEVVERALQAAPPLCVPVHSPLYVLMCGVLWRPGVLGRGTFCCVVAVLLVVD